MHERIESATLDDLGEILELNQCLILDIPEFKWGTEEYIRMRIEQNSFYVIRENSIIIAALSLVLGSIHPDEGRDESDRAIVAAIVVREDQRSRGIGRTLLHFAEEWAKQRGRYLIEIDSFDAYQAGTFYSLLGYECRDRGEYQGAPYSMYFKTLAS